MDFHSFKSSNPEMLNLNREIQQLRYEHYEKLRQDTIKAVKQERNKIIEEDKLNMTNNESKNHVFIIYLFIYY
jgi:hypothetical protein